MKELTQVFEALIEGFEKNEWERGIQFLKLVQRWENIVGEYVSKHTQPLRIIGDVLFVGVDNSVLMHQLSLETERIKENIKRKTGYELQIKLMFSPVKRRKKHQKARLATLNNSQTSRIEELTARVKDPEIRDLLRKAMASLLARRGSSGL